MKIHAPGYLDFESLRYEQWLAFGPEVLGLQVGERGTDGAVHLSMDHRHRRLFIHPGYEERLSYVGWELADKVAFEHAVPNWVFVGNPDEIADRILHLHSRLGHTHHILQTDVGGLPQRDFLRGVELLGTGVLPQIRYMAGLGLCAGLLWSRHLETQP